MKAQLFSSLYTIIFASVIISVLVIFNTIILDWKDYSLLENEVVGFETMINLISLFDDYSYAYNTSLLVNVSISEFVNFTSNDASIVFDNNYGLPSTDLVNLYSISINRVSGEWIIS